MMSRLVNVRVQRSLLSSKTLHASMRATYRTTSIRTTGSRSGLVIRASWGADVQFSSARVLENENVGEDLNRLLVDIGKPAAQSYTKPGQFIQAKIADSKPGFFALASAPDNGNNDGVVELLIKNQPGATAELICGSPEGAELQVSAPMGKGFPIDNLPPSDFPTVFLFATGSGISPIKALIESGALSADKRKDVRLYYGARNSGRMAYEDKISEWESQYGVKVIKVFSDDGKGYIQDVFVSQGGVKDGQGVGAVLCGQKEMAQAVTEILTSAGVGKEAILMNF